MCDEEDSFVILGTSPTPSMDVNPSIENTHLQETSDQIVINNNMTVSRPTETDYSLLRSMDENHFESVVTTENDLLKSQTIDNNIRQDQDKLITNSLISSVTSDNSMIKSNLSNGSVINTSETNTDVATVAASNISIPVNSNIKNSTDNGINKTLTQSCLLTSINSNALQSSLFGSFPSLLTQEAKLEDIMKLRSLLKEHDELKSNLQKTNVAMRQHFATINKWQDKLKIEKREMEEEIKRLKEQIARQKNHELELVENLTMKTEQFNHNMHLASQDNYELRSQVSEKESIIRNMSAEIEKLEKDISTFEFVDRAAATAVRLPDTNQIKLDEMTAEMNNVLRENQVLQTRLDACDDNIKLLEEKCRLTETKLTEAASLLQANDSQKLIDGQEKIIKALREEIEVLQTQLQIYKHDFELERKAREEIAGEKESILSDLKLLQRRNQQLIEEAQNIRNPTAAPRNININMGMPNVHNNNNNNETSQNGAIKKRDFPCPLCRTRFSQLAALEVHVQDCLDGICFKNE